MELERQLRERFEECERAAEMLKVAGHLEAAELLTGRARSWRQALSLCILQDLQDLVRGYES
jgi:hypothetical protein